MLLPGRSIDAPITLGRVTRLTLLFTGGASRGLRRGGLGFV
jgi:hypothetical protein